jgi:hypothetical protein
MGTEKMPRRPAFLTLSRRSNPNVKGGKVKGGKVKGGKVKGGKVKSVMF